MARTNFGLLPSPSSLNDEPLRKKAKTPNFVKTEFEESEEEEEEEEESEELNFLETLTRYRRESLPNSWTHTQKNGIMEDIIVSLFQSGLPIDQIASSPILGTLLRIGISVSTSKVESIIENYSSIYYHQLLDLIVSDNIEIALSFHSFAENGETFMSLNAHCLLGDQLIEFVVDSDHSKTINSQKFCDYLINTIKTLSIEKNVVSITSDYSTDAFDIDLEIFGTCPRLMYSVRCCNDLPELIRKTFLSPYDENDPIHQEESYDLKPQSELDRDFEALIHSKDTVPYFEKILDRLEKFSFNLKEQESLYQPLELFVEGNKVDHDVPVKLKSYSRTDLTTCLPALTSLLKIHPLLTSVEWEIIGVKFKIEQVEFCKDVIEFSETLDLFANLDNESGLTTGYIIPLLTASQYQLNKLLMKAIKNKDKDLALSLKTAEEKLLDYNYDIIMQPLFILASMLVNPIKDLGLDETLIYLTKKQEEILINYITDSQSGNIYESLSSTDTRQLRDAYRSYEKEMIYLGLDYLSLSEYFERKTAHLSKVRNLVAVEIHELMEFKKAFFQIKRSSNEVVEFYIKNETIMKEKFPLLMKFIPRMLIIPGTKSSTETAFSDYKKLMSDQMRDGSSNRSSGELSELLKAKSMIKVMSALRKS